MSGQECPSLSRLLGFALGELSQGERAEVETHLGWCSTCRSALGNIREAVPDDVAFLSGSIPHIVKGMHSPLQRIEAVGWGGLPCAGEIWVVQAQGSDLRRLVLVLRSPTSFGILQVMLLSPELEMASSKDAVLSDKESPTGYALLAETWNRFSVLVEQCVRYVGALDPGLLNAIRCVYRTQSAGGPGIEVGPPLVSADEERADFQDREAGVARALSRAALRKSIEPEPPPEPENAAAAEHVSWEAPAFDLRQVRRVWIGYSVNGVVAPEASLSGTWNPFVVPLDSLDASVIQNADRQVFRLPNGSIVGLIQEGRGCRIRNEGPEGGICAVMLKESTYYGSVIQAGPEKYVEGDHRRLVLAVK